MLLVPKRDQRRLDPVTDGAESVDAGVAGGAQGNQQPPLVDAGTAVVNGELTLGPTPLTLAAVANEHGFALAGEAEAGVGLPRIATRAQAGAEEACLPAGAEKPGLPGATEAARGREKGAGPAEELYSRKNLRSSLLPPKVSPIPFFAMPSP